MLRGRFYARFVAGAQAARSMTGRARLLLTPIALVLVAAAPDSTHNVYPWATPTSWDVTLIPKDEPGLPFGMTGRLFGLDSLPAAGVKMYVYHADDRGWYARHAGELNRLAAVLRTDAAGRYRLHTILPGQYGGGYAHAHFEVWEGVHPARAIWVAFYRSKETPPIPGRGLTSWADREWSANMGILTVDSSGVYHCQHDIWMSAMVKTPASYDPMMDSLRARAERSGR